MDAKSKQQIGRQYDALVAKYGFTMHALYVEGARYDRTHQEAKFQYVLDQLDERDSLLDVGCGLGHLSEYCRGAWKGRYTGIDISGGMVEAIGARLKTGDNYQIRCINSLIG